MVQTNTTIASGTPNAAGAPGILLYTRIRQSPFYYASRHPRPLLYSVYNHTYHPRVYGDPVEEYWQLLNGVTLYENQELDPPTGAAGRLGEAATGPLMLQEHGMRVQFQNVWVSRATRSGYVDHGSGEPLLERQR